MQNSDTIKNLKNILPALITAGITTILSFVLREWVFYILKLSLIDTNQSTCSYSGFSFIYELCNRTVNIVTVLIPIFVSIIAFTIIMLINKFKPMTFGFQNLIMRTYLVFGFFFPIFILVAMNKIQEFLGGEAAGVVMMFGYSLILIIIFFISLITKNEK